MSDWKSSVGVGLLMLALASCTPGPEGVAAASQPAAVSPAQPPATLATAAKALSGSPRNQAAPTCKIDGCCAGHGDVAYVQRDFAIICTDGQASEICDCHT